MTMDVVDGTGYRLELDYEAPLLRASVSGGHDTGLAVSREYWLRILDHARACGASQLLVLDGMLPGFDGLGLLAALRVC